jgi:hypothetical protein
MIALLIVVTSLVALVFDDQLPDGPMAIVIGAPIHCAPKDTRSTRSGTSPVGLAHEPDGTIGEGGGGDDGSSQQRAAQCETCGARNTTSPNGLSARARSARTIHR